jgi:uncharacterized protein (DUF427 family)
MKKPTKELAMPRAMWNGVVLAENPLTEQVEGNHYFSPASIHAEFFRPSETHSVCGWKGTASYYDIVVDGKVNKDAAWYYPEPLPAASNIKGYIAFWKGVQIEP